MSVIMNPQETKLEFSKEKEWLTMISERLVVKLNELIGSIEFLNPTFIYGGEAEERFLYTKLNEIDRFDALKTSGRSKAHFQIMCLAFDPANVYGQTRVGTGSVSERVCIRFNWNASTTIECFNSHQMLLVRKLKFIFSIMNQVDEEAIFQGYKLAFPENAQALDEWMLGLDEYRYW